MPLLLAGFFAVPAASAKPAPPAAASDAEVYGADFFQTFSAVPIELPADSALRHELFDSIRKSIPPDHKFEGSLKVYRNWAFFGGETVDAQGKVYYYPNGGSASAALWLRTGEGEKIAWKLVAAVMGAPYDMPYKSWPYRYGAPYLLLGMDPSPGQSGANLLP
ncbi:MAG: hypothetical protein ACREKL_06670 [Chthoniobacterales bacterium]